jgi:hypothetical protein
MVNGAVGQNHQAAQQHVEMELKHPRENATTQRQSLMERNVKDQRPMKQLALSRSALLVS